MGVAKPVKLQIARFDPVAYPALTAAPLCFVKARRGAGIEDFGKCRIAGDPKVPAPQHPRQRVRAVKAIERQNCPGVRLNPEYFGIIAAVGHRKNAGAIGKHQQVGGDDIGGERTVHSVKSNTNDRFAGVQADDSLAIPRAGH